MSACISSHGEYSDHEAGDWCPRCGAFNESAIVAERDALREKVQRLGSEVPTVADHEVTLAVDGGYATREFVCNAPAESLCHADFDCGCEHYYHASIRNGVPSHRPDPRDDDTWHTGRFDPTFCNLRDWFEADDGESLTYRVTLPVRATWEGDFYSFEAAVPEPGGSDRG